MPTGQVKASWLNDLQTSLNTHNSNQSLPQIAVDTKSTGDPIKATDISNFITKLNNLKTDTFLQYGLWTTYPMTAPTQSSPVVGSNMVNIENLVSDLKTINGNYSVSASNSNTANSNFSGCNQSVCGETFQVIGFSNTCNQTFNAAFFSRTFTNQSNQSVSFSKSGNSNVGTLSFAQSCSQGGFSRNSANFTTFSAGTTFTNKKGNTNNTNACSNTTFSKTQNGFSTQSNCTNSPTFSGFSVGICSDSFREAGFSQSFSDSPTFGFSRSFTQNTNQSFLGGNSNTCNTTLRNFSVRSSGTVTNSNITTT